MLLCCGAVVLLCCCVAVLGVLWCTSCVLCFVPCDLYVVLCVFGMLCSRALFAVRCSLVVVQSLLLDVRGSLFVVCRSLLLSVSC